MSLTTQRPHDIAKDSAAQQAGLAFGGIIVAASNLPAADIGILHMRL
jgi:hypothetical protein